MMSILLPEIVRELRQSLNLSVDQLGVRFNHKPPPLVGDLYVAVYGTEIGTSQPDLNTGIDLVYSIGITVTKRVSYNPYEMLDVELFLADTSGMEAILHKSCAYLHQNFDLLGPFNERLRERYSSAQAFIEPFRFKYMDATPTVVTEKWFEPEFSLEQSVRSPTQDYPYCGMIMESFLGECRRVLTRESMSLEAPLL